MHTIDMTNIDMHDEEIDFVFCSHVLEHVEDDASAMSELYLVLNDDGELMIQAPMRGEKTYEDFMIRTQEGRRQTIGQEDHVRIYGFDIAKRLSKARFHVNIDRPDKAMPVEEEKRMNTGGRPLIMCRKSSFQASQ